MMKPDFKPVFGFSDYRVYLKSALDQCEPARGARSRLAKHLGCQTAFVSQVLAGKVDFSLEHAVKIGAFLGLPLNESRFLVLLIHLARAGSRTLREYYQTQIDEIREKQNRVEERIEVKKALSFEDQATYYDGWYYAAIHVALSVSKLRTAQALSARLEIPLTTVQKVLEHLVSVGLATHRQGEYQIGERRIHLTRDSIFVRKHHVNWRMKAIQSMDFASGAQSKTDLHYSGVFSLSEADFKRVRELWLEAAQKVEPVVRDSNEETLGAICLDWFRL